MKGIVGGKPFIYLRNPPAELQVNPEIQMVASAIAIRYIAVGRRKLNTRFNTNIKTTPQGKRY